MKASIAPKFKVVGFRRSAGSFFRDMPTCLQVVNYQKSGYSDSRNVRFTINVGLASKRLWSFSHWSEPIPATFPEFTCHVSYRIGHLLGSGDPWWVLDQSVDLGPLAEEHKRIAGSILPWLHRCGSDEGLAQLALQRIPSAQAMRIYDAVLLHTRATMPEFAKREAGYRKLAETNGQMDWVLERLDEERTTWT